MIEVRHLSKYYGDEPAILDLSFTVEDGLIYGFLGPNGAGKTTTMNIMTGYLSPSEGEVILCGHDLLEEPEAAKRTIGYLPEIPPLYPELTVEEYLDFACALKGIPRKGRRDERERLLKLLELEGVRRRLIRNLSKGYRQRVGLAQALAGDPGILILDEPTAGLDPKQVTELRELILDLRGSHTVLWSSHILSEVAEICDRVLILSEGRLAACDTPAALQARRGGGTVLHITAAGSAEEALRALSGLFPEAAEEAVAVEDKGEGKAGIRISLAGEEDLRPRVSSLLHEAGCPVLEMFEETTSLEDIFLRLTDAERPDRGQEAAGRTDAEQEAAEQPDGGQKSAGRTEDERTEGEPRSAETEER